MKGKISIIFLIFVCVAALAVFSSCEKEPPEAPAEKNVSIEFDPNGGRISKSGSVSAEGKLLSAATAVRDGYVLMGWYTDKDVWTDSVDAYENTIPLVSLRFFAKWGVNVSFEYNDNKTERGVIAVETGKRLSSTSAVIPTPTRVGYTFVGWYYDNSGWTNALKETDAFASAAVLYAYWTADINATYELSDGEIIWDSVPGAISYKIQIGTSSPQTISGTRYAYSASTDEFSVKLHAYSSSSATAKPVGVGSFTFAKTETVAYSKLNVIESNGKKYFRWEEPTDGIAVYEVYINSSRYETSENSILWEAAYGDSVTVKVRPLRADGDGGKRFYSDFSDVVTFVRAKTVAADSILYDGETLRWTEAENAVSYAVEIDGVRVYPVGGGEVTEGSMPLALNASFSVTVTALGRNTVSAYTYVCDGYKSGSRSFEYVAPTVLAETSVREGVASWEGDGAYTVRLTPCTASGIASGEGEKRTTEAPTYSGFLPNKNYLFSVKKQLAEGAFTSWSNELRLRFLAAPTVRAELAANGVSFVWNSVDGAEGYTAYFENESGNSDIQNLGKNATNVFFAFQNAGSYSVSVVAKDGVNGALSSLRSTALSVTRLSAPTELSLTYNGATDRMELSFTSDGNSFEINTGFAVEQFTEPTFSFSDTESLISDTNRTVKVWEKGNGTTTLDSAYAEITYKKLAAVTELKMATSKSFSWNSTDNAKFDILLDAEGYGGYTSTTLTADKLVELFGSLSSGEHQLKVRKSAEGACPSAYVTINFTKAYAPTNLAAQNGILSWNYQGTQSGYKILSNGVFLDEYLSNASYTIDKSAVSINGTTLAVVSIGSAENRIMDSNPSATYSVFKLATPTARQSGDVFEWDSVPNAISYRVMNGNTVLYNGTDTELALSDYAVDEGDLLTVTARGNASVYFDSESSAEVEIAAVEP